MEIERYILFTEKQGTPSVIDKIIEDNLPDIIKIIKKREFLKLKILENDFNVNVTIYFKNNDNYKGDINYYDCVDSNFEKCVINVYYPINYNMSNIIKLIVHELTHLYELYKIKDIFNSTKWTWQIALNNTSKQNNISNNIRYFRDILYLSLPQELNARVSSLYRYLLMNFKRGDSKDDMIDLLKKTNEWLNYLNLMDFSYLELYNSFVSTFKDNYNFLYFILNELNYSMGINYKINNLNRVKSYLNKFEKKIKDQAIKYKKKILRVVNRVFNELNENVEYLTYDPGDVNFEKYNNINILNSRERKILDLIEYEKYIKKWK